MAIQIIDNHWVGSCAGDIGSYLEEISSTLDPTGITHSCQCACGSTIFHLLADSAQGSAQRLCASCGAVRFVAGSEAYWREAHPKPVSCSQCGSYDLNLALGFALHSDGEVSWVYVGSRCIHCGSLTCPVDWANETYPSHHLLEEF